MTEPAQAQQQDAAAVDLERIKERITAGWVLGPLDSRDLVVEVQRLQAQLVTAEAERGEERRHASRLFDDLRAQVEVLRSALEAFVRRYGKRCQCAECLLARAALARLDEQPGASQQTPPDAQ